MTSVKKITDMGLLTELAYLKLESDEFKMLPLGCNWCNC